jgi:hypothetical protein
MDATAVRARAADLVRQHASRLGMDEFAARSLVRAIEALPAAPGIGLPSGAYARGVSRDAGDERTLCVAFDRRPSDDDLRAVHDLLRGPE